MKRSSIPTVVLIAATALVALLVYGVVQQERGIGSDSLDRAVQRGELPPAPMLDLKRPFVEGAGQSALADYSGKVVVLNFWASWCVPCRDEAPALERTQKLLAADDSGTVLGVTYQDSSDAAKAFTERYDTTYPSVRDPDDELVEAYGSRGIPETFVLDGRGRIVAIARGEVDQGFLDAAVAKAKAAA